MILITGGAGYIGSHTCIELLNSGYEIVIIDNFENSKPSVIENIKKISNKNVHFVETDLRHKERIRSIFQEYKIDAVIHFAGLKAVGESVKEPLRYYDNNLISTIHLCEVMQEFNVKKLIFSSSATVYHPENKVPYRECNSLGCTNPYGWTKYMIEQILRDLVVSDPEWSVALLRYFNPIGAHESGLIGDDPNGIPNNLMPYIAKVASGELEKLHVFGNDYPTKDGTGVRDYIHVVDLANGHLSALTYLEEHDGIHTFNLGTGIGYSVLDIIEAFQTSTGVAIDYVIDERRPGDIAVSFADPTEANQKLGWTTDYTLEDMCLHVWNFIQKSSS